MKVGTNIILALLLAHICILGVSAKKGKSNQEKCDKEMCNIARSSLNFDRKCLKAQFCMKGVVKDAKKFKKEKEECLKERRKGQKSGESEEEKRKNERVIKNHQINNDNLQTKFDELKKNYDSIIGKQQKLEMSVNFYKEINKQLKSSKEEGDKEIIQLKISVKSSKASNEHLKSLKEETEEENTKFKKEIESLVESAEKMNVSYAELTKLKTNLETENSQLKVNNVDLRKQSEEMKEKFAASKEKNAEEPDSSIDNELKAKNEELKKSVSELSDRNYKLTEKITDTINSLSEVNLSLEKQLMKYEILKNETIKIGRKYKQLEVEYKQLDQEFDEKVKNNTKLVSEQTANILQLAAQLTECKEKNSNHKNCASELSFCRDETVKTSARLAKIVQNKQLEQKSRKDEMESYANETCQNDHEKMENLTIQLENCQQEFIEKDIALKKETQNFSKICREQHPELEQESSEKQAVFREKDSEVLSLEVKNQILSYEIKNLTDSLSECNEKNDSSKLEIINLQEIQE